MQNNKSSLKQTTKKGFLHITPKNGTVVHLTSYAFFSVKAKVLPTFTLLRTWMVCL
jgi:hypothetical protein